MKPKMIITTVTLLSLGAGLSCSSDTPSTPEHTTYLTAETAPLHHLLPEETVLAVELRDLPRRWNEIRSIRSLARFQDQLLQQVGLNSDDIPLIAGERCVVALVSSADGRTVVPIAVLLPPSEPEAHAIVESLSTNWTLVKARGALWIGPQHMTHEMTIAALGNGTSLADVIPTAEASHRLPTGGLVRGWVNPMALKHVFQARVEGSLPDMIDVFGMFLSAELEAVRWIAFRRDVELATITTDASVAYDLSALPPEVASVFNPVASKPQMPVDLPSSVVVAAAFRPEAEVTLAWLRYVAQANATSSLRNLDFWIDEFENRYGHDLESDLFEAVGEHGWFLGLEGVGGEPPAWLIVLQAKDANSVESTLLNLLNWSKEHAWARTLGLAVPRIDHQDVAGATAHVVAVRTPFGQVAGPLFATVDDHLVAGTDENALQTGIALVRAGSFSADGGARAGSTPAHASFWARGPAVTGLAQSILELADTDSHNALVGAVAGLIAGFVSAAARAWYEQDALLLHGEIELDGS
ncbi:MAG: hypothetical protein JSW51_12920 [Gemmatimonadota bacterium]|nr:MAG: hypothetical protein JSW51_12920 [Gemmatimonadota bacterium]